jgi:hypothetical protein
LSDFLQHFAMILDMNTSVRLIISE